MSREAVARIGGSDAGVKDPCRGEAAGGGPGIAPGSREHRWSRDREGALSGRISRVRNAETVRHEAPCDRVEVKRLHRQVVAAA